MSDPSLSLLPGFAEVSERLAKNAAELLRTTQRLECPQPENATAEALMCLQLALGVALVRAGFSLDLGLPVATVLPGIGLGIEMESTRKSSFLQ